MWIFLDIDGVLVPEKKFDQPVLPKDMIKFDPVCLDEFENVLRRYPTSKIVISSSWREMYSLQTISSLFSPDIAIRVIGVIPYLHPIVIEKNKYIRHQGVLEFLRQNNEKNPNWVAIDDIADFYEPGSPVIVTNAYHGFNHNSARILDRYLASFSEKITDDNTIVQ
ncbi:MAG: HAD domain-containing protein [Trichodesmium sp. St17_bin3_1_1]|nr:HAD domain-containing protein [Trichodesmium sp. St17_bin3_1_1]MDE5124169.1 HAD domain-containing protein [Trichodesmium sp. St19_bin1]